MEMYTMEEITEDAIVLIVNSVEVTEAIDATVAMYDLNPSEHRQLIQRLAKEGFKS